MKYLFISALTSIIIFFSACKNSEKNSSFNLVGKIEGLPTGQKIYLELVSLNNVARTVDSTITDAKGFFVFQGSKNPQDTDLFKIKIDEQHFILFVNDGQNIKIKGTIDDINNFNYTVEGSVATDNLRQLMLKSAAIEKEITQIRLRINTIEQEQQSANIDSFLQAENQKASFLIEEMTDYYKHFADTSTRFHTAVLAAYSVDPYSEMEFLDAFAESVQKRFAEHKDLNTFMDEYKNIKQQIASTQSVETKVKVGMLAPDFSLPSDKNTTISLSSFRGQYVLLDFWASWCPPCRVENPHLVALYNEYKNENFTILGVSLDDNKERWKEAISKDKLSWTQVSDLKKWNSEVAALYGVFSIPANFLIDPNGNIIATNLRGTQLQRTIRSVIKKEE